MKDVVLDEKEYQRIKKEMNKVNDYYSIEEINLMQFLMQRRRILEHIESIWENFCNINKNHVTLENTGKIKDIDIV